MDRKSRLATLCLVLSLCVGILGGCGVQDNFNQVILIEDQDVAQEKILRFFAPMDTASSDSMYYRELIDQYNAEHTGIRVVFEGISTADGYNQYLEQRLDAGEGDDVFIVNADMVKPFYRKSYFYNLSDFSVFQKLNDSAKEQAMIGETAYCLPVSMTAYCLFVNLDVLKQYGLEAPQTMEEFRTCCRTIKAGGGTPLSLNRWYALTVPAMANGLYQVYQSENVQAIKEKLNQGDIPIGDYMREGFQVVEEFIREGWYGDGLDTASVDSIKAGTQDIPDFASGKTAFYFGHLNAYPLVEDANPDVNYIMQGVPIPGGTVTLPAALTRLCINANSDYLEETVAFADFLSSNKYQEVSNSGNGLLPIYKGVDHTLSTERMRPAYETFLTGKQIPIEDMQLRFTYWDTVRELCIGMFDGVTTQEAITEYNRIQAEQIAQYAN